MSERIQVDQALFGYREGHNLVAASLFLDPKVRQFLANVTDGSGAEQAVGPANAYTGLPVPDTSYYALFCTWPAPEMPRPGCVWSHTLLIDFGDLARVSNLGMLRKYLKRPDLEFDPVGFETPIEVQAEVIDRTHTGIDRDKAVLLLEALYGNPVSGIVLLDRSDPAWEEATFAIWSQQWPRLRRSFAFSTGSLDDRRHGGLEFDLQIGSQGTQRLWRRSSQLTQIIEAPGRLTAAQKEPWLQIALDDLGAAGPSAVREFLARYGSELDRPRASFSRLLSLFERPSHDEEDETRSRLASVAAAFPEAGEAFTLKRDELAQYMKSPEEGDLDTAMSAIYFLLHTDESSAFDKVPFDFQLFGKRLWKAKRADVMGLLDGLRPSQRTNEFRRSIALSLVGEDLPTIWRDLPAALGEMVRLRPELATEPSSWSMSASGQEALWGALDSATGEPEIWASVCVAMLKIQCNFAAASTVEKAFPALPNALSRWLESRQFQLPQHPWRVALAAPLRAVLMGAIESAAPLFALAVWALPFEEVSRIDGRRPNVQAIASGRQQFPEPLRLHTAFWLCGLGLKTDGPAGANLLESSFFSTYDALASSNYPGEAWERLSVVLPEPAYGFGWDRCKLLCRGLRDWVHSNKSTSLNLKSRATSSEHDKVLKKVFK